MWLRETPNAHAGNYLICVPHENGTILPKNSADDGVKIGAKSSHHHRV